MTGGRQRAFADLTFWLTSWKGAIAQLGERVLCKHEVVGSIPSGSTKFWRATVGREFGAAAGRLPFPIRCNFISSFVEARERVEKR